MDIDQFHIERERGVATVTFDRPPVNAQNRRTREELTFIFDSLSDDPEIRAIILTGGGKVFSAGADIKERSTMTAEKGDYIRHNRLTRECFYAIRDCAKPVIAAVNGPAIGAGFALMANCDILLASDNAFVQMAEVDVGLAGGAKFLEILPRSKARTMFFTARRVPAVELHRIGVIEACLPQAELMGAAMEIAHEIAAKPPGVIARNKYAFNTVEEMSLREGYRFEQGISAELSLTEETRQAQRNFSERRKTESTPNRITSS